MSLIFSGPPWHFNAAQVGYVGTGSLIGGICSSIFTVAFENCLWQRPPGWARIWIVGGFGLVHGMGFAGRLAQVKWPAATFGLSCTAACGKR